MFKKSLAIFLGAVMLLTQLISIGVFANGGTKQWSQGFEDQGFNINASNLSVYTKQLEQDAFVHSGQKSIHKTATANSYISPFAYASATEKLVQGREYHLSMWVYLPQKITATSMEGAWQVTYLNDKSNAYSIDSNVSKHSIKYFNASFAVGEWKKIELVFTANASKYMGLYTYGAFEMYIDDIVLTEVSTAKIIFNSNGGSAVNSITGDVGATITMPTAPTKEDYDFAGWYTDAALTVPFMATTFPVGEITLYAKWRQNGELEQNFENYNSAGVSISNNNFTIIDRPATIPARDGSVGSKVAKDVLTSSGTHHLCAFPGDNTAKLLANTEYSISFWVYSVTKPSAIDIRGISQNNAGWENGYPLLKRFGGSSLTVGQWVECTGTFTPQSDVYISIAAAAWTTSGHEVYIDDIVVTKIDKATITFNSNGGSEVTSITGNVGSTITMPADPIKENYIFAGWYTDAAFTTPFNSTTFPKNGITLYAKWKQEGVYEQNFESYDASVSGVLSNYTLFTSNGTDGNAHSGTKSLYRSAANSTFRVAVFPNETKAPIVQGNTYELRFWVKIASAISSNGTIQYMYSSDKLNCNAQVEGSAITNICVLRTSGQASTNIDAFKVGEWQEVVYTFSATHNGYLNLSGWGPTEYYLDDISLKCTGVANATITFNSNGGSAVNSVKGVAGTALSSLPVPTKAEKIFDGWYLDEALTTRFTGTVFPEGNITLYAKWVDEGIYFQDFEGFVVNGSNASNTLSVYTKQSENDPLVYSGTKALHKPAVNNSYFVSPFPYATKKLEAGKGYKLNMWVYVPNKIEKANEGAWQITLLDEKSNAFSYGERKKTNIKYFNSSFKEGEWQRLELIFTASDNGFMGLYAYGSFEMYIDDISLIEVDTVTVTFDTCGGNAMESKSGPIGMIVSSVPTPTHPEEKAFAGWFVDKEYTKRFNFKEFPATDITVYAKWIKKGSFEQNFEEYYYENDSSNGTYTKDTLSIYHATSENDEYVHSGKSSMRYYRKHVAESKTYGFSIFDPTMGQLKIGEKYYVSYWMKFKDITSTFYHAVYNNSVVNNAFANYDMKGYFTTHADVIGKKGDLSEYFFGPAGKYFVSEPDENGWIKFTFETIATDKYFSIYVNYDAEVYIDDVVIEPLPTGVVQNNYSKPAAEPLYDEIHSNCPAAAITRSNEEQVYKLELASRGDYVFSVDIRPNTMGAYAALSFDGVNIIEDTKITLNEAKRVMLDITGVVYLHVYNPIGESLFGRLMLFNTRAAKIKAAEVFEPNLTEDIPELSELLKQDKYLEVLAEAEFMKVDDDSDSDSMDLDEDSELDDSTSPQTGDNTSMALIFILFFTASSLIFVSIKKRGRKYE